MKAIDLKSLSVGVCIGVTALFAMGATPETPKPIEYKVITGHIGTGEFETKLNNTVPDGWRLQEAGSYAERYGFAVLTRDKR